MREAIAICQSLPGPLAIQVGVYASIAGGFWGAGLGDGLSSCQTSSSAASLGFLYVYLGDLQPVTAIFYGVSPAVIALILHSCYRLAKLGMEDWLQWVIAAVCLVGHRHPSGRGRATVHRRRHRRHPLLRQPVPSFAAGGAFGNRRADSGAARTDCFRLDPEQAVAVFPQGGVADLWKRPW